MSGLVLAGTMVVFCSFPLLTVALLSNGKKLVDRIYLAVALLMPARHGGSCCRRGSGP